MRKFIIILVIIVIGLGIGVALRYFMENYSINYLYNKIVKQEFAVNPRVEIDPEKDYKIDIWYYPFYKTIDRLQGQEHKFFEETMTELSQQYPNIELVIKKINFLSGEHELFEALKAGKPPDIYFNFSNDSLLDQRWQIPIEEYLSAEEKEVFYNNTAGIIKIDNHIWGWPLLAQQQKWLTGKDVNLSKEKGDFNKKDVINYINNLDKKSLLFNYQDPVLLRQLLSLYGLKTIKFNKSADDMILDTESARALRDVFTWLHQLRVDEKFAINTLNMEDSFLKTFFNNDSVVLGPVNLWLERILINQKHNDLQYVYLDDLNLVYTMSIFRQKSYKGHDHTRAVMEVARIIAEKQSNLLADQLGVTAIYNEQNKTETNINIEKILEITPAARVYWEEKVIPVWLEFWKQGLTPEEVLKKLNIIVSET